MNSRRPTQALSLLSLLFLAGMAIPIYPASWKFPSTNTKLIYSDPTDAKVGIGTVNPQSKVEVAGNGAADGAIRVSKGYLEIDGVNVNGATASGTDNLRIGYFRTGVVGFNLQGLEAMSLSTSGVLKLTSPGSNGTLSLLGDSEGARLIFGKNQGGTRDFRVDDAQNGEIFRVTNDGMLALKGHSFISWNKDIKTISFGDVMGGDDGRAGASGENLTLRTKDRDHVRLNGQGLLGVGNPNDPSLPGGNVVPDPRAELDLRDSRGDADELASLYLTGNSGGAIRFYQNAVEQNTIRSDQGAGELVFQTGGTSSNGPRESLRIKANGDAKLTGKLETSGIITKTWTVAPDYVFEKNYKLAKLEEVDAFVKKNKHLPDVPSAKTFKEEGMDLAEMNFILLRKVEELTLHMIRQEQEIKKQAAEIRQLKKTP